MEFLHLKYPMTLRNVYVVQKTPTKTTQKGNKYNYNVRGLAAAAKF